MNEIDRSLSEIINTEERVYDGKLVKVNRMDVTLPSGRHSIREAVRHIGASAVVPVDEEGNVTLVRQFRTAINRILMEIPAGKLDAKDEDRLLAAKRELREETGLTADKWVHLTDLLTTPGFCDEKISLYLAMGLHKGEDDPDEDEFLNVVTMPMSELKAMAMRGEIEDSKTLTALLLADLYLSEAGHGVH